MYSVIIPTMWKVESFPKFLKTLSAQELISEVIIVNNDIAKTPSDINKYHKIKLLNQDHNIGVNPAWNLGVLHSNEDLLCILNDDIEFDISIFDFLKDKINTECGMIGIDIESKTSLYDLQKVDSMIFAYACLFFIHKKNYITIPESLKVFYGDNWLFDCNKLMGKLNKKISGGSFKGLISATSKDFMQQSYIDRSNYALEYNTFIQKIKNV